MKLCRLAGRPHVKDIADFYFSHTPYEWLMQHLLNIVEPFGDDRADERAKINSMYQKAEDPSDIETLFDMLTNYAGNKPADDDPNQLPVDPTALAAIKKA